MADTILKRKLSVEVITGEDAETIEGNVADWLSESQSEDRLVGEPKHEIAPDGTHVAYFYYVEG